MSVFIRKIYEPGQMIFKEGEAPGNAYLVRSGKVEISRVKDGKKTVLAEMGRNTIFGEMSLIDAQPRSATAIAAERTEVAIITQLQFNEELDKLDPFMQGIIRILANRVRTANERL